MFRELRRQERALSKEQMTRIMQREKYGVLSLYGDNGYPYGVPLHYVIIEDSICFHCSVNEGHKKDAIKNNSKVSFTIIETEDGVEAKSVIMFGKIIEIPEKRQLVLEKLVEKFVPKIGWSKAKIGIPLAYNKISAYQIECDHISGKWVEKKKHK